jgi:hypothetical protein
VKKTYHYGNGFNFILEGVVATSITNTARGEEHLAALADGTRVRVVPGWIAESWVPAAPTVQRDTDADPTNR